MAILSFTLARCKKTLQNIGHIPNSGVNIKQKLQDVQQEQKETSFCK